MSQHQFTTTRNERVEAAVAAVRKGRGVLVVDDEDRENEGDIIFSAASITHEQMALLIRECSGIVCLCLPEDKVRQLDLPQMVANNTCKNRTAFTISIEAAEGVTTGVSAADRVKTIRTAIADDAVPGDLNHPGHVFPLCARSGGVRERAGHTEASVDLMRLAGLPPYGVLCELTNPDGTMARLPEIMAFSRLHDMPVLQVRDLIEHMERGELDMIYVLDEPLYSNNWNKLMEQKERVVFVTSASLGAELEGIPELTVEDLLDRPFYLTERDTNYRRVLDRFLAARNRSLTPFLECSDTSFLIRILENNRGVSLLPWYAVEQSVGQGKLSLIQVADFHVTLYRQIFSHKEKWCSREMDEFVRTVQELEAL